MGGAASRTRKLTVENEDSASVIKVSEDVVQRLKGEEKSGKPPVRHYSPGPTWPAVPEGAPMGLPPPHYFDNSLTSLQLRQEKEEALKKNDKYWERRIEELEKCHGKMHEVMEAEYQKAVKEIATANQKRSHCTQPPCQDRKKAVLKCYKKYPCQPMRCLKEVEEFAECVDVQRNLIMSNQG